MTPRYRVDIVHPVTATLKAWDTYTTRERAEEQAAELRKHGLFSQVRRVDDDDPPDLPRAA